MRLVVASAERRGEAADATGLDADAAAIHRAIAGERVAGVTVDCPDPGPVHDRVGVVREGAGPWLRGALAAAARSLGERAPQDDEVEALRARLD
ncbi:MAG: hypothetical protein V5A31_06280, partial [Haloferacaceae archaeon]